MLTVPAAVRQGEWISPEVTLTADGYWRVAITGMLPAERLDPTLGGRLELQVYRDGAWQKRCAFTWRGGPDEDTLHPVVWCEFDLSPFVGMQARAVVTVPNSMTFGLEVERIGATGTL